jgi:CHASE1-domain containing sensor protein
MVTDANAIVLRTAATASALLTVLAATLAISSTAVRSPAALRKTIDELGKRLRRRVAAAQADPDVEEFARRCFYGPEVEGNA